MKLRHLLFFVCTFFLYSSISYGQDIRTIDSLKKRLAFTKNFDKKYEILESLSYKYMDRNIDSANEYGEQLIFLAESSRNREWMIKANLSNGSRCAQLVSRADLSIRTIEYFNKGLALARQNKIPKWIGVSLLRMSRFSIFKMEKDKALNYANEGASVLAQVDDDSLKVESDNVLGDVYLARNNKTLALRYYLSAQSKAEDIGNHALIIYCYQQLGDFYSNIEDYDRAIDFYTKSIQEIDKLNKPEEIKKKPGFYTEIGRLYSAKKENHIAERFYQQAIKIADSLKEPALKVSAYVYILNQYINSSEPQKALTYFNSSEGLVLKNYLSTLGYSGMIDQAYAVIYTQVGQLDSARLFFNKCADFFLNSLDESSKYQYYAGLAHLYEKSGKLDSAIYHYQKIEDFAKKNGMLEWETNIAQKLDSLFYQKGDFKTSKIYTEIYYKLKDSTDNINKEKEMAQVEAADEQARLVKLEKLKEENKQRRLNIQYTGITIGIAFFFALLVFMGIFKVSESMIKLFGFFGFIMFFEFLILIADTWIHDITHGEPWKVLGIKIILIALLLPFHHWLEKKTINYLTSHNHLTKAGQHFRRVFGMNKKDIKGI